MKLEKEIKQIILEFVREYSDIIFEATKSKEQPIKADVTNAVHIAEKQLLSLLSSCIDNVIGEDKVITEKENNSQEGVDLKLDYEMCRKVGWNNAKEDSRQRKKGWFK